MDAEWTRWDYRLVKALELYDDMKAGTGIPIYWDRSDRVRFETKAFTSKSKAALDRAEESAQKGNAKNFGKVFYVVPETIDGGPLPTLQDWLEEEAEKRSRTTGNFRVAAAQRVPFSNEGWTPPEA